MRVRSAFLTAALMTAGNPAHASTCDHAINWQAVAKQTVLQAGGLKSGERAIILYSSDRTPELIPALRDEIRLAGGILLSEWPRATNKVVEAKLALPADQAAANEDREDAAYGAVLREADVLFALHSGNRGGRPKRWEKLLASSKRTRSVHFHWFEPELESDRCAVLKSYAAAMAYPKDKLLSMQTKAVDFLKGAETRITNAAGTNLTLRIPANARIGRNDGELTAAEGARARSTRDKEEEFPASAIRTTNGTIDGVLVARSMFRDPNTLFKITFSNSQVVAIEGPEPDVKEIQENLAKTKGAHFAELVIGLNPMLDKVAPSGWPLYYGSGGGMVQIRIGDNWESGGRNRSPNHWQDMFILSDATVAVKGVKLLTGGNISIQSSDGGE